MVTPKLVTQHRTTTTLVSTLLTTTKSAPQQEDPVQGTFHPLHTGPGGKHQVHMLQISYKDSLQEQQNLQTDLSQA